MSARYPKLPPEDAGHEFDEEGGAPLFSAEAREALRRELGPGAGTRDRVRSALWSSVAGGAMTPGAERVAALMKGHTAAAAGAKAAAAAGAAHSLATKLVVLGLVVAGGTTAVVLHAPSKDPPRPVTSQHVEAGTPQLAPEPSSDDARRTAPGPSLHAEPGQPPSAAPEAARATAPSALQVSPGPPLSPASADRASRPATVEPPTAPTMPTGPRATRPSRLRSRQRGHGNGALAASSTAREPQPRPSTQATDRSVTAARATTPQAALAPAAQPVAPNAAATPGTIPPPTAANTQPTTPTTPPPTTTTTAKPQLAAELELVRSASEALRRGDAPDALDDLRSYAQRFPHGALRIDAAALHAMALCAARDASAPRASAAFVRAHPGSALAERVRRACAQP